MTLKEAEPLFNYKYIIIRILFYADTHKNKQK